MIIETNSPEETFALGEKIGTEAQPGQLYTLIGDLGVGKTVLTQGIAKGLGIEEPIWQPDIYHCTGIRGRQNAILPFRCIPYRRISKKWMRSDMRIIFTDRG